MRGDFGKGEHRDTITSHHRVSWQSCSTTRLGSAMVSVSLFPAAARGTPTYDRAASNFLAGASPRPLPVSHKQSPAQDLHPPSFSAQLTL